MIYLDNAASTQMRREVIDAMNEWNGFANASSIHKLGIEGRKKISEARQAVAKLLNCDESQVVFTSGGTESNATVMRGFPDLDGKVAISRYEHESVMDNANIGCALFRLGLVYIPVSEDGIVKANAVSRMLSSDPDIKLVSVMAANNEIGTINDVKSIASVCHKHDALFHTDCVQAVGSIDLDTKEIDCDFLSLSAHKFHGPKGVGVLYCKDITPAPLIAGAQEGGLRGGTENIAGIIGTGVAAQIAINEKSAQKGQIMLIKRAFCERLKHVLYDWFECQKARIIANSDTSEGKIVSVTFDGVDAQSLVLLMSARNAYISAGSACNANKTESSHVLKAIGLTDIQAHNTVRVSFSYMNSIQEVMDAAGLLGECVRSLGGG